MYFTYIIKKKVKKLKDLQKNLFPEFFIIIIFFKVVSFPSSILPWPKKIPWVNIFM